VYECVPKFSQPVELGSAIPVMFRVLNADSLVVPDVRVRFSTWASVPDSINHPGTVVPQEAATDSAGIVTVTWTVDTLTGMYALEAEVEQPDGNRLHGTVFVLVYDPDAAPAAVQCLDPSGTWEYGGSCAYPALPPQSTFDVTFRVVDNLGLPIAETPVRFHVDTTAGEAGVQDGTVNPDSALTDSLGTITALWTIGQYPGTNRLVVSAGSRSIGVTVAGFGDSAVGTVVSWANPAGGSWHDSTSWDVGRVPGPLDTALITLSGTYTVSVTDSVLVYGLELGAPDGSSRTLTIDQALFELEWAGVVHPGGTVTVNRGAAVGVSGQLRVAGGEIRLSEAVWRLPTLLQSGALFFEGSAPHRLGSPFTATGGDVIWRNADTLLVLEDSATIA